MIGPEDLGQFFDDHGPALVLYARQWCDAAEDVVQDAFVKLAQQSVTPDHVAPWLYRVVRNAAINARRDEQTRRRIDTRSQSANDLWFTSDDDRIDAVQVTQF